MRKQICLALVCLLPFIYTSTAIANGLYAGGNVGLARVWDADLTDSTLPGITAELEFDKGVAITAALGYDFGCTRLEGEISYQKNGFERISLLGIEPKLSGSGTSFAMLINGYYDFTNDTPWTPFLTAGLGFTRLGIRHMNFFGSTLEDVNDHDTVFAYQVGAGLGYALSNTVTAEVKYRYFAASDPEYDTIESEFSSHNLLVGMRFTF